MCISFCSFKKVFVLLGILWVLNCDLEKFYYSCFKYCFCCSTSVLLIFLFPINFIFCFGFRRAISVLEFGDSSLNSVLFTNKNHKDILKFCYTGLGTSVPF